MSVYLAIAGNEFRLILKNPVVLVSTLLLAMIAVVSTHGLVNMPDNIGYLGAGDQLALFMGSIGGAAYVFMRILIILSACIGVFSIADEKRGGILNVLVSKPLYRRDVLIGKFIGLSWVLLLIIGFVMASSLSVALIMDPVPAGLLAEIFARISYVIITLVLLGMVLAGISMMIAIIFRNIAIVITIVASFLYVQLFGYFILGRLLGPLIVFEPYYLSNCFAWGDFMNGDVSNLIFITSSDFLSWFPGVYQYFLLLVFEVILVILIDCVLFNSEAIGG